MALAADGVGKPVRSRVVRREGVAAVDGGAGTTPASSLSAAFRRSSEMLALGRWMRVGACVAA